MYFFATETQSFQDQYLNCSYLYLFLSHIILSITVQPTISLPGDKSPVHELDLDPDSSEEDAAPVGDIFELTSRVKAALPYTSEATLPTQGASTSNNAAAKRKGKGKGIGKGYSGSSGPPVNKGRRAATPPPPDTDSSDIEDEEARLHKVATQGILVKNKRGYTTYPAFLFDIPPQIKNTPLKEKAHDR